MKPSSGSLLMNAASLNAEYPQSKDHPVIFIIIPAYNEGTMIVDVLTELRCKLSPDGLSCQIVIVDDGSRDDTYANIAQYIHEEPGQPTGLTLPAVHLLRHYINLGQGAALGTGIQYALAQGAEILITYDADGQHDPEDIPALIAPITAGKADVALGSRFLGDTSGIPSTRQVLLKAAIFFTGVTDGIWLTDAHNGFRALSAGAARQIEITQNRMAHASEIIREIARLKLHYVEVPVHVRYTDYSRMKGQRASDALNILLELLEDLLP